jgi:hypothetical protein
MNAICLTFIMLNLFLPFDFKCKNMSACNLLKNVSHGSYVGELRFRYIMRGFNLFIFLHWNVRRLAFKVRWAQAQ